jgi:hypothetical protein
MTLAEQWKAEGEARGEASGRLEGEARGLREVLVRLLVLKFGSISVGDQARISTAAKDQLLLWSERVLSADSLAAVFNG